MKYFVRPLIWVAFSLILVSCANKEEKKVPGLPELQNMEHTPSGGPKDSAGLEPVVSAKEQNLISNINKYPDSSILLENLIQYNREIGNYQRARKVTDEAIAKFKSNPRLYYIKATLAYEDEDTLTAIRAFEKAISIFPDPEYYISLATLYAETKNPRALKIADLLISGTKTHKDKDALFIKGLYYSHSGEPQKALAYFDKAINLSYTFMEAYREKALALYHMGKYNDALEVLNKALTIMNSWDEGYYYSGMVLEKLNNIPDAITSYQNALTITPNYSEARDALIRLGVH